MPLVACPDCAREVSDSAPSCPGCGRPIATAAATVQAVPPPWQPSPQWQANQSSPLRPPTVIEQTSKKWKSVQLYGALASIFGIVFGIVLAGARVEAGSVFCFLVALSGFVAFIVGRVGAWWNHG